MTAAIAFLRAAWPYLLGAALAAAGWAWYTHQIAAAREYGREIGRTQVQAEWDKAQLAQAQAAAIATRQNTEKKEQQHAAINTAQTNRAAASQRDQAGLPAIAAERARLRSQLASALDTIRYCGDLSTAAAHASADTSAAVNAVFDALAAEAENLAQSASGHAADSLMYQQAWPK